MGHGPWTNETSLWQRYLELLEKNNITVKKLPAENKSELVYDSSLPVGVVESCIQYRTLSNIGRRF